MKTTIKFAALGAVALAASSTAALADSQRLPASPPAFLSARLCQKASTTSASAWCSSTTPAAVLRPHSGVADLVDAVARSLAAVSNSTALCICERRQRPDPGFQNGLTNVTIHWDLGNGCNFGESRRRLLGRATASSGDTEQLASSGHADVAYIAWRLATSRRTSFTARVTTLTPLPSWSYSRPISTTTWRLSANSASSRSVSWPLGRD